MSFRSFVVFFFIVTLAGGALFSFIVWHESPMHFDCPIAKAGGDACGALGAFGAALSSIRSFTNFLIAVVLLFGALFFFRREEERMFGTAYDVGEKNVLVAFEEETFSFFIFRTLTKWLAFHRNSPSAALVARG